MIQELTRRAEVSGLPIASPSSLQILLSNFENGKRAVNEPYRSLFRAIYGMTDDELFAPVGDPGETDNESAEYAALAARVAAARQIDHTTASLLSAQTDYLRAMDCRVGGAALVDQMNAHLTTVQEALSHAILPSIRRPLAAVLADAAALAAWQALDVGAISRAWRHHETARYAALEARDTVLLAHAMAQQAFVLVDVGDIASAVELVGEALSEAGTKVPARFQAWVYAAKAEVLSAANEVTASKKCFDEASQLLPAGPDAVDPEMPFIVLNEAHLARWRGNALATLGDETAINQLQAAVDGGGIVSTRAAAALHCDLAKAYLALDDRSEARAHATEGRKLAKQAGSIRQKLRIERLALMP
ncbi:XRE family transcriptional regulator [Actinoplanes siamensis]|uniref:XRE family transcriptional regulator n=1 Tax=Actinoplanes siamensis TaxID=1223317 RepID=UPI00360BE369